jgi:hypothetical protein
MKKLENDYWLIRRHMLQFSSVVRGTCREYRDFAAFHHAYCLK